MRGFHLSLGTQPVIGPLPLDLFTPEPNQARGTLNPWSTACWSPSSTSLQNLTGGQASRLESLGKKPSAMEKLEPSPPPGVRVVG